MPREEDLPGSKRITALTAKFHKNVSFEIFSTLSDNNKIDILITFFIKEIAILQGEIELLKTKDAIS